ncbi:MAG TPA: hypothetical protein VKG79_00515, partial [Bryobacteraceae bacterium]|nr:hypothetical protein [Bryobacteraceae bacterium]
LVNGIAAPVYLVSQSQISALIPYEIADQPFATFQVVANGSKSNMVTVYVDNSSPGIYTLTENGIGAGAILHADYTEVSDSSPAKPGETVIMFLTGLGPVTPGVADGAAAPGSPVSKSVEAANIGVFLGGSFVPSNVLFAGLAPGFAGLYQVNFTVPDGGLTNGDNGIAFETIEGVNQMATISLGGFSSTSGMALPSARTLLPRSRTVAARARSAGHPKNFRRALPAR